MHQDPRKKLIRSQANGWQRHDFLISKAASASADNLPPDWTLEVSPLLPVSSLYLNNTFLGWILGYFLDSQSNAYCPSQVRISPPFSPSDGLSKIAVLEAILHYADQLIGRFVIVALGPHFCGVIPDASSSLSIAIDHERKIVASRAELCGRSAGSSALADSVLAVRRTCGTWYPCGLTEYKSVTILLPNHYLDLNQWQIYKYIRPPLPPPYRNYREIDTALREVGEMVRTFVAMVQSDGKLLLNLTSGRDSRMLLAICRYLATECLFHTFETHQRADALLAPVLAKAFALHHVLSDSQPKGYRLMQGLAGEVGRAFYWRMDDLRRTAPLGAGELIERMKWGPSVHPSIREQLDCWLAEHEGSEPTELLDYAYIELRLACAMGPAMYVAERDCELAAYPFNGWPIFERFMRLPKLFRIKQKLAERINHLFWQELNLFPYHSDHWAGLSKWKVMARLAMKWPRYNSAVREAAWRCATRGRPIHRVVLGDVTSVIRRTTRKTEKQQ